MTDFSSVQATYDSGMLSIDSTTGDLNAIGNCNMPIREYYYDHWYPYNYPTVTYIPEKSKIEKAFNIINFLTKKNAIDIKTVKGFVDLVSDLADML